MTTLLLTAAAMCGVIALALWLTRDRTEYIYYDPSEVFPPRPQPYGIDDYKPWPAMELSEPFDAELDARLSEEFWQVDVEYQRRWGNE